MTDKARVVSHRIVFKDFITSNFKIKCFIFFCDKNDLYNKYNTCTINICTIRTVNEIVKNKNTRKKIYF